MAKKALFDRAFALYEGLLSEVLALVILGGDAVANPFATQAKSCGFRVFAFDAKPTF